MLILGGNGTAYLYSSADDDFVAGRTRDPDADRRVLRSGGGGTERAVSTS